MELFLRNNLQQFKTGMEGDTAVCRPSDCRVIDPGLRAKTPAAECIGTTKDAAGGGKNVE